MMGRWKDSTNPSTNIIFYLDERVHYHLLSKKEKKLNQTATNGDSEGAMIFLNWLVANYTNASTVLENKFLLDRKSVV